MNIYELSKIIPNLKYEDYSSEKIKSINYNSKENILTVKYDKQFQIEVNLNDSSIKRVIDLGKVENIGIYIMDDER